MHRIHRLLLLSLMVNIGVLCEGMTVSGHSTFIPNTSAVLHISYDGALFHGWSAGNDGSLTNIPSGGTQNCTLNKRGRSRRNKNRPSVKQGEVRSVQGILRAALAKIYGNVEINRVVVEGASRTDAGVSAKYMIALVYCLNDYTEEGAAGTFPIEGKRLPHPISPIDKGFKPLPFKSDLKKIVYALNKMLPPDVSVRNVSTMPLPTRSRQGEIYPFHPSLDSVCKTYSYTFSIGELYDPIKIRNLWHVVNTKTFNITRARECCTILSGEHDFIGFRGAFRGNERGKVQDTVCNIHSITIDLINNKEQILPSCDTYRITVSGNRFLYKMVRFLVGTIVQYGTKPDIPLRVIRQALKGNEYHSVSTASDDPKSNPRFCAPPNGLILDKIDYGEGWSFDWIY